MSQILFEDRRETTGKRQVIFKFTNLDWSSTTFFAIPFKLRKLNYKYDRKIDIEHGCIKKI